MTTNRIIIDPYFDGEPGITQAPPREDSGPPATPPTQHGYHDAGQEMTATGGGRSALQLIGTGAAGLRGVVIPRSTMGGIPQGTRPHATAGLEVTIDPHIVGQSARVRLGDVTEESVKQATEVARGMTPEPYNIETQRLRGAAELHAIAAANNQSDQNQEPPPPMYQPPPASATPQNVPPQHAPAQTTPLPQSYQPPPQQPAEYPAPPQQSAGYPVATQPQPHRRVSPLQAFNQRPSAEPAQPLPVANSQPSPGPSRGAMPTIHVFFEVEGFGGMEAYYHDIVVQEGFLVLLFDANFRGPKYFPPTAQAENQPRLAMNVVGTREVYQLQTTGVLYEHDGYEHCVLMIEQTGQLPQ